MNGRQTLTIVPTTGMSRALIESILSNPKNLDLTLLCQDGEIRTNSLLFRNAVKVYNDLFESEIKSLPLTLFQTKTVKWFLDYIYYEEDGFPIHQDYDEEPEISPYPNHWKLTFEDLLDNFRICDYHCLKTSKIWDAIVIHFTYCSTLNEILDFVEGRRSFHPPLSLEKIFNKSPTVYVMGDYKCGLLIVRIVGYLISEKSVPANLSEERLLRVCDLEGFDLGILYILDGDTKKFWQIFPEKLPFSIFNHLLPKMLLYNCFKLTKGMVDKINPQLRKTYSKQIEQAMERYRPTQPMISSNSKFDNEDTVWDDRVVLGGPMWED